jgi:hypothetical protein
MATPGLDWKRDISREPLLTLTFVSSASTGQAWGFRPSSPGGGYSIGHTTSSRWQTFSTWIVLQWSGSLAAARMHWHART